MRPSVPIEFSALYAPGYKHNPTYKHAILGPERMLIERFYCIESAKRCITYQLANLVYYSYYIEYYHPHVSSDPTLNLFYIQKVYR
jgi:hypothetical protein